MTNNNAWPEFLKRSITGIILIFSLAGAYIYSSFLFTLLLTVILLVILASEWPGLIPTKNILLSIIITIAYPIMPFGTLIWLVQRYYIIDFYLPLYPFLVAWTADTFGYFVGKIIGYHKIYPSISAGKSWEGLAGSIVGVFVMHLLLLPHINIFASTYWVNNYLVLALFSVLITVISFFGGFLLSILKRNKNLKDAGSLLPGHGGFLDRFDGVLFVTVATTVFIILLRFYNFKLK